LKFYLSGQEATIQKNNCGACITLADKFDDYYDSKAGIDDSIKQLTNQMCADDDCKKSRIAKVTPLVLKAVDQEAMMRDVCQYTYNCFAENYEYNGVSCNTCKTMLNQFFSYGTSRIATNAVISVLQANNCAGEWAGDAARVECNTKVENFMKEFRGDFNDVSASSECCKAAGVCC